MQYLKFHQDHLLLWLLDHVNDLDGHAVLGRLVVGQEDGASGAAAQIAKTNLLRFIDT